MADSRTQTPVKRQKRAHSDENSDEMTKIIDLNYDCLENFFDRLDLREFFNAALSNKLLQLAAASSFKRKFGIRKISLNPWSPIDRLFVSEIEIYIGGLKSCLQFVRCFGENFTDLILWNGSNHHLNQYIEQYCAEALTKIRFAGGSLPISNFQKSFNKVDVVDISNVNPQDALARFADWFPNISCAELMRANPQLQTIELTGKRMAMKRTLDIIQHNYSISKLQITHSGRLSVRMYSKDAKRVVRDHPLLVEFDVQEHLLDAREAMILIRQLNALKIIRIAVNSQSECNEILKQLDNEWHHEIRPPKWPATVSTHVVLKRR